MKMTSFWIFYGCFICVLCSTTDDQNVEQNRTASDHNGTALYRKLFENYNPNIRPVFDVNTAVTVNISLDLVKILKIDEINQTFKTSVNIIIQWTDELLTWNGNDFGNINRLVLPLKDNIWLPDIMNFNAAYLPGEFGQKHAFPILHSFGLVTLWTTVNFETQCLIHTKKFPLDTQYCSISFSTLSSTDDEVRLRNTQNSTNIEYYTDTAEWSIIENYVTTDIYFLDGLPYRYIIYNLTLKRTCTSCIIDNIFPILVLAFLNLLSFFVPSESGEKLTFPMSIFLTLAVFLTIIMMSLPESVDGVSYLSTFVTFELSASAVTLLCTVITLRLHHEMGDTRVPVIARLMVRMFRWNYGKSHTKTNTKGKQRKNVSSQEILSGKTELHENSHVTCREDCGKADSKACGEDRVRDIKWDHVSDAFDMMMFVFILVIQIIATTTFLALILT